MFKTQLQVQTTLQTTKRILQCFHSSTYTKAIFTSFKQSSCCFFSQNVGGITLHNKETCPENTNKSTPSSKEKLREMIQQYSHSIPDHLVRASSRTSSSTTTTNSNNKTDTTKLSIDLPMDPKNPYGDQIQMKEIKLRKQKTILELHFTINNNPQPIITSLQAELLRVESPSAEVQGEGGQKRLVFGKRGIKISNIEMVGTYAIRIIFSDGHDTGIYSWNYLHTLGKYKFTMMKNYINDLRMANKSRVARVPKAKPPSPTH